jgi:endonuclease-3
VTLAEILDQLEAFYGRQEVTWPTDPYQFIVWWHCGYPASDAACAKGWAELQKIGVEPRDLLEADPKKVAAALKAGGMVPELRALRLKEIAQRAERGFAVTRADLKKFSNIADPGADRILLFSGKAPIAAVPSNVPHVAVRIFRSKERENYGVTYRQAQELIERDVPETRDARERAFLLLKRHGQEICKRTNPKCAACPIKEHCRYAAKSAFDAGAGTGVGAGV